MPVACPREEGPLSKFQIKQKLVGICVGESLFLH